MKPLPKETFVTPKEDMDLAITIKATLTSEDDLTVSMGHSVKGVYHDFTDNLVYILTEIDYDAPTGEEEDVRMWEIDMVLTYPYSEVKGHLILSVGDSHSGGITTTRLVTELGEKLVAPFFDPVPESVFVFPDQDVLINTMAKGSTPIEVGINLLLACLKGN